MRPRPGTCVGAAPSFFWADIIILLDREIGIGAAAAIDTGTARALTEILDRDCVQPRHDFLLERLYQWRDDTVAEIGAGIQIFAVFIFDALSHAHNVANGNTPP